VTVASPSEGTGPDASPTEATTTTSAPPVAGERVSTFDADDEGWTISGDAQAGAVEPNFAADGGNPGGFISADDDVAGGVWFFKAPEQFGGDASAAYGGTLEFDMLITEVVEPFAAPDVILASADRTLVFDLPADPGTDWTHQVVPLDEAVWLDSLTSVPPTQEEFLSVLASVERLQIRGEFNTGPDTGSLDNVRLG
jgi:laminin B (domain IV)